MTRDELERIMQAAQREALRIQGETVITIRDLRVILEREAKT